ncbi:MAG: sugar ABC transporter permease [Bacillota bacterium]
MARNKKNSSGVLTLRRRDINQNWTGILLIAPAVLIILAVILYPLGLNLVMSFQKILMMKPYLGKPFIAFENYTKVLGDPTFWRAARNSLVWTVSSVSLQVLMGLTVAVLLNKAIKGRGAIRGMMLIPWITPGVVAAIVWKWMYDGQFGILNYILMALKIIDHPIVWLGNVSTAFPAIIFSHAWKNFPFAAVMLLAAMQIIPRDLYEAADIDGANAWQKFVHITLARIRPTLYLTVLLTTIWTFNSFDTIWLMTEGGPSGSSDTLTTYVYKATFQAFNLGKAAAIAVLMFLALFSLVLIYARAVQKEKDA